MICPYCHHDIDEPQVSINIYPVIVRGEELRAHHVGMLTTSNRILGKQVKVVPVIYVTNGSPSTRDVQPIENRSFGGVEARVTHRKGTAPPKQPLTEAEAEQPR